MNKLKKVSYESEYTFIFFGHVLDLYDPVSYKTGSYKKSATTSLYVVRMYEGTLKGSKTFIFRIRGATAEYVLYFKYV